MRTDVTEDANLAEGGEKTRDRCTSEACVASLKLPGKSGSQFPRRAEIKARSTIIAFTVRYKQNTAYKTLFYDDTVC